MLVKVRGILHCTGLLSVIDESAWSFFWSVGRTPTGKLIKLTDGATEVERT